MVAEDLGEGAGAVALLVTNANGRVVVSHLTEECRAQQGDQRDGDEKQHRTRRRETLASRGGDDCYLPGLHDGSSAWLHTSRRTGVKARSASTFSRVTVLWP